MAINDPSILIILINWNGYKDTSECIKSLLNLDYSNYRIIVVDNASTDDSLQRLKEEFGQKAHFIQNKKNLGFTGANNVGFQYALVNGFQYVFVLNNDTVVDKNSLKALVSFVESNDDKNLGIISPKIYNYYKKDHIESKGGIIDIVRSRNYPLAYGKIETPEARAKDSPYKVSFATGSAMFISAPVLRKIGFFDDAYFAYYEDQDYCFRAEKAGFSIWYCPGARIWHKVSSSTGGYKSTLAIYLSTRNRVKFVLKNGTLMQKALFFPYFFVYYVCVFSAWNILHKDFARLKSFWKALFSLTIPSFRLEEIEPFRKGFLRIGINARYLQRQMTGIERYTSELIRNLGRMDSKDKFMLFFNKHERLPNLRFADNIIPYVSRFPTKRVMLRILWEELFLYFEIRKKKLDIFHGPSFVVPLIKPKNCKYVITIHDLSWFLYPESFTFFNKLFFKIFLPVSILNSDRIIADSLSTKGDIIRFFNVNPSKIEVIYLGIDDSFIKPLRSERNEDILRKYGLPKDYILSIGSLLPRKNVVNIIKAFNELKKKGLNDKLVIIGKKAWLYDQIFSVINDFNIEREIIFTGYVDDKDLPFLYSRAKLLLFPSLYEGFGLPILEAMACGCPVITSNVSSMPEVAGDAALLVNPDSVDSIVLAMEKILYNDKMRESLISKGYIQARRFNWKRTAKQTLALYRKVYDNKPGAL